MFVLLPLTQEEGGRGPARSPGCRHTVLCGHGNTRLFGPAARSAPRSAPQEPFRSPVAYGQEGGRPALSATVGWLSLKRRAVARPAARPLTPAPGTCAETGPRPGGSPDASDALRQACSRLRWRSGPPTRVPALAPRITGEVSAPLEKTDQTCAIFGFVATPPTLCYVVYPCSS
ncbi:hypothetical protein NDU88_005366 [Pleurodeles waltl]|uniref:Uncharacterized protein n=1 Tax=Pleurodeles waltl TaxID=8319 RepID=A0AAV7TU29_PLEWA|nr:hypothetical protein NDU88_005366 [Pleurodeles waltl]